MLSSEFDYQQRDNNCREKKNHNFAAIYKILYPNIYVNNRKFISIY